MQVSVLSRRDRFLVTFPLRIVRLIRSAFRVATPFTSTNVERSTVVARIITTSRSKSVAKSVISTRTKEGRVPVNFYHKGFRVGDFLSDFGNASRFQGYRMDVQSNGRVCIIVFSRIVLCAFDRASRRACSRILTFLTREVRGLRPIRSLLLYIITSKANIRGCDVYFFRHFTKEVTNRLRSKDSSFAINRIRLATMDFSR